MVALSGLEARWAGTSEVKQLLRAPSSIENVLGVLGHLMSVSIRTGDGEARWRLCTLGPKAMLGGVAGFESGLAHAREPLLTSRSHLAHYTHK